MMWAFSLPGVKSIIEVKWRVVGGSLSLVIICKLSQRDPLGPIILMVISKNSEVMLYLLVDHSVWPSVWG